MEGTSRGNPYIEDMPVRGEQTIQLTREELRNMIEEAGQNAIIAYEKRVTMPQEKETTRRQLFKSRQMERVSGNSSARELARAHGLTSSEAGSTEVDHVGKQIASLAKQIDELKKRGELVVQNRNSPFDNKTLMQIVDPNFRMPDLSKYDGMKDPLEHLSAFELVMNLYGQPSPIMAKLFVTTLTGKAQEWFTSLPCEIIETYEQLLQKFKFHFAYKRKQKRCATYLFTIRQREDESLKSFMGRFNNETLEVQDLRIDMMVSILIHGLKKGSLASTLARDPPTDVEQLMAMAQKDMMRRR
ncbi:UNVERIFIED_CONTAM: hypothetical protein Sindi_0459500 [Sesamum indicum]